MRNWVRSLVVIVCIGLLDAGSGAAAADTSDTRFGLSTELEASQTDLPGGWRGEHYNAGPQHLRYCKLSSANVFAPHASAHNFAVVELLVQDLSRLTLSVVDWRFDLPRRVPDRFDLSIDGVRIEGLTPTAANSIRVDIDVKNPGDRLARLEQGRSLGLQIADHRRDVVLDRETFAWFGACRRALELDPAFTRRDFPKDAMTFYYEPPRGDPVGSWAAKIDHTGGPSGQIGTLVEGIDWCMAETILRPWLRIFGEPGTRVALALVKDARSPGPVIVVSNPNWHLDFERIDNVHPLVGSDAAVRF